MGKQLMTFLNYVKVYTSNNVDENTACKKYKEYMASLTQSKVSRFFEAHKDREWFRLKYHPIEGWQTLQKQYSDFQKRLQIFNQLNEKNYFDNLPLCITHSQSILNLLDAVLVKLDDGPQALIDSLLSHNEDSVDNELRLKYVPSKPASIVIDDLSIDTTLSEVKNICMQANQNIKRITQCDPYYVSGGHLRRKFVVIYHSDVDVKDVCWLLSRTKHNNQPLSIRINSCLTRRIYSVDAISNHHVSIINDIRHAIVLILYFDKLKALLDKRIQTFEGLSQPGEDLNGNTSSQENGIDAMDVAPPSPNVSDKKETPVDQADDKPFDINTLDDEKAKERKKLFDFKFNPDLSQYRLITKLLKSKNPILEGAYVYLIDYLDSAQAVYQLSRVPKDLKSASDAQADLNQSMNDKYSSLELAAQDLSCSLEGSVKFLDRLLWYLRIVHSFDYYKKTLYRQEDDLTLRMGVIHVRGDPADIVGKDISRETLREHMNIADRDFRDFALAQSQKYISKDEERFNYRSYGKVISDELSSYAQRAPKAQTNETEEVYKCKHCAKVFQKMSDIGLHFLSKHRLLVDTIELETDFYNAYLFDCGKINPCAPAELLEVPMNRFARMTNFSQMGEDPDLLQQTIEAYKKMDAYVREPAPRSKNENDPRNELIVEYNDISFDDAI